MKVHHFRIPRYVSSSGLGTSCSVTWKCGRKPCLWRPDQCCHHFIQHRCSHLRSRHTAPTVPTTCLTQVSMVPSPSQMMSVTICFATLKVALSRFAFLVWIRACVKMTPIMCKGLFITSLNITRTLSLVEQPHVLR